jgi:hypothetical protein
LGVPKDRLSVALIELDRDTPPARPSGRPPARSFRPAAVAAAALLALALGGAAPAEPVLWQRVGLVPLAGASTSYQLVDGVLYTLDGNANRRTTTAWALHPLRRLWNVSTDLQLDESGTVIHDSGATLAATGGHLLLQSEIGATVVDPASGTVRWSTRASVIAYSGGTGVVQQTVFPPGTEYDQSSGDPGALYWSADGRPHTEPPERTIVHGVDLSTGRDRWTLEERGSVYVVPATGDSPGFVVIAADRLIRLAADTGAVIRQRAHASAEVAYPEIVGDLLILRHDVSGSGAGTATAFDLSTFERRWEIAEPEDRDQNGFCTGLICERGAGGLAVLDPVSGAPAWLTRPNVDLITRGHDVLEVQSVTNRPLGLLDLRTGRERAGLAGWDTVADSPAEAPIVLFRAQPGTGRAGFGVLTPGARKIQLLGLSSAPVRQCASDDRYVACRIDDGVEVWAYRV